MRFVLTPHGVAYLPRLDVHSTSSLHVRRLGHTYLIDATREFDQSAHDAIQPVLLSEFLRFVTASGVFKARNVLLHIGRHLERSRNSLFARHR